MKNILNLFLTLSMPLSILFTAIAIVYYSIDFEFSKSIKLGILTGVLMSITFAVALTPIILVLRALHLKKVRKEILSPPDSENSKSLKQEVTIYEKKTTSPYTNEVIEPMDKPNSIEEKLMLLMDKELAYEVSLASISQKKIGEIIYQNKEEGILIVRTEDREIKMAISPLTKHTAQVIITTTIDNSNMKNIISMLKEKEHSFLQY